MEANLRWFCLFGGERRALYLAFASILEIKGLFSGSEQSTKCLHEFLHIIFDVVYYKLYHKLKELVDSCCSVLVKVTAQITSLSVNTVFCLLGQGLSICLGGGGNVTFFVVR